MLQYHLNFFRKACFLSESLGSVLIHWNEKKSILEVVTSDYAGVVRFRRKLRFHLLIVLILAYGGYFKYRKYLQSHSQLVWTEEMLFAITLVVMIWANLYVRECQAKSSQICFYINSLLNYPKLNIEKCIKYSNMEKLNILYIYSAFCSVSVVPALYIYALHWCNPCKPTIAGFWLLSECRSPLNITTQWFLRKILKFGILYTNHWMWNFGMNVSLIAVCGIMVLSTMTLRRYIET